VTYEQLDAIADSYIPLLLIITLFSMTKDALKQEIRLTIGSVIALILSIVIVYGVMFADIALSIWPSFGADYSTHTALALVFVCYFLLKNMMYRILATLSLIAYFALMMYQQYHTLLDILSTTLVIMPVLLLLQRRCTKHAKYRSNLN